MHCCTFLVKTNICLIKLSIDKLIIKQNIILPKCHPTVRAFGLNSNEHKFNLLL